MVKDKNKFTLVLYEFGYQIKDLQGRVVYKKTNIDSKTVYKRGAEIIKWIAKLEGRDFIIEKGIELDSI